MHARRVAHEHERAPTTRVPSTAFLSIEQAAPRLDMTPIALRARCRRASIREGRDVVARLGAGVVAYKIGTSWRVCFPAV
jgi:hypothetical protein